MATVDKLFFRKFTNFRNIFKFVMNDRSISDSKRILKFRIKLSTNCTMTEIVH